MPRVTLRMNLTAGGGLEEVIALHDHTSRTILLKSTGGPLFVGETCSLCIDTDVSAVEDESRAICIFCPR